MENASVNPVSSVPLVVDRVRWTNMDLSVAWIVNARWFEYEFI